MNAETLFENFATFAEAPNGVTKLRELILQLAIQGKLVPQDKNDEPASVLADRIEAERGRRIKAGELRDSADELRVDETILPFSLPPTWKWVRLGRIMQKMGAGSTPLGGKKVYVDDGIKFLRSQNVWDDGLVLDDVARIAPEVHQTMSGTWVDPGDVLLNITGASIGRSALVPDDFGDANVSQHVAILRLIDLDIRHFLHLCVISPFFQATIMRVQVGVSREGLSMTRLREFPFPLPPLAEQRRIVEKVDQLLGLCDELAARQAAKREVRSALVGATLDRVVSVRTAAEFPTQAKRLCDNFDLLFDTSTTIPQLRQTILQLAVQGQLVPQDPSEESPVTVLVGDVVDFLGGYAFKSEWFQDQPGIRLVRNQNVSHGDLDWSETEYLPTERAKEFCKFELHPGDLVLSLNRPFISTGLKLAWIKQSDCPCLLVQRVACMRPVKNQLLPEFLYLWCNAPNFYRNAHVVPSSGVPYIATNRVEKMAIWLPPLSQQKRIVLKVTELLSLCDALAHKLTLAESASPQLLSAAVHKILEGKS